MPKPVSATKYYLLAQKLRRQIKAMKPGQVIATVTELKNSYGLSQATVDRALNQLRNEGLIRRPSGQMRLVVAEAPDPAVKRIAIIRPDYPSPTFEELVRHIVTAGKRKDWAFELTYYRKLEAVQLDRMVGQNDAAIFMPSSEPFPDRLRQALHKPRRPVLVIQDPPLDMPINSARIDDQRIGRLAVEHLLSLGHQNILLLLSEPKSPSSLDRMVGWRQAMLAGGVEDPDALIVDCQPKPFANTLNYTYEFFGKWLDKPHPPFTAIFCAAWTGAMAVMRALREHHIAVPNQVSVISHGGEDHIGPFLNPPLTAIETDMAVYGRTVIELLDVMPNRTPAQKLISSSLVVRETTAAPTVPVTNV